MKFLDNFLFKHFEPAFMVASAPYCLVFKTTNYCLDKCPHCCENSGPDQEKTYIPEDVICGYIDQALLTPHFDNNIVFTGGEIFSAYKFYDKQYVPNLLKYSLKHNIGVDIKTNAGWVGTSFGKEIFKDLKNLIIDAYAEKNERPPLQISLSIDKYHTNCLERNLRFIKELAGLPIEIHVSTLAHQMDTLKEFEDILFKQVKTKEAFVLVNGDNIKPLKIINNHTIYESTFGTLFKGGRAFKIPEALDVEFPQFSFCTEDLHLLFAFDNFGRVTLGENCGQKIMTPWVDEKIQPKKLNKIHDELIDNTFKECLYYNCYERFFRSL